MTRRLIAALAGLAALAPTALLAFDLPPEPPKAIRQHIGLYGTPDAPLVVYEKDGRLWADGAGVKAQPLRQVTGDFYVTDAGDPRAILFGEGAEVGGLPVAKRDFGAETAAAIQSKVRADPKALRARAAAATPPAETPKRAADLVSLRGLPGVKLDIRYATTNNFMGVPLYERAEAYLQRPAAEALARAAQRLKAEGYGLMIHDAYRPWSVTWMFWEATPPEARGFVADPAQGSRHNRGAAVDLTLYDLKTGKAVEMPGRYDEMSLRSYPDFVGGTSRQRALRDLLRAAMEAEGFAVYPQEWWHFDHKDWRDYGIGNVSFSELAR
ncbi:M15 family metallopeptidase [Phenylobacterium sp. J367]|uniref:M15 family metallopeptidase n=1 Tax=Phenylobacterium sp. J367 TaxID=2898435 RepID=UPI0021517156|nr:M15 family metallopeptidase [Phenylobacterium sp. J367]MCR5877988.1 M15 family metallopeptidase [Phenylobacterium sp. J367]